jgi:hypothetical protein
MDSPLTIDYRIHFSATLSHALFVQYAHKSVCLALLYCSNSHCLWLSLTSSASAEVETVWTVYSAKHWCLSWQLCYNSPKTITLDIFYGNFRLTSMQFVLLRPFTCISCLCSQSTDSSPSTVRHLTYASVLTVHTAVAAVVVRRLTKIYLAVFN